MSLPKTTSAWVVEASNQDKPGWENLKLVKDYPVAELGENDCLVQIEAVSLNYRDLIIPKGLYPMPLSIPVVACSDGAGHVLAVGSKVSQFKKGDHVVTLFTQDHQSGEPRADMMMSTLGGAANGTLRQYAVFPATGLALAPSNLSPVEASTLSCAPLTSWNALFGLQSKAVKPGDVVLTQGTGGVSLSAIQFAKAAGAIVIATTSSDEKAKRLKDMGADFVIDYKKDPNWGETAKKLSPGQEGADHIIEVGGPGTMEQSLKAVKLGGVITVIGFLDGAGQGKQTSPLAALMSGCIIRGILVGPKTQLVDMNRGIAANNIHPIVDPKVFKMENAHEAYEYQWQQKSFGKTVIQI